MPDFLPRREGQRVAWTTNLARKLVQSPGEYALTPGEAQSYGALQQRAAIAYQRATEPGTRTTVAIAAKKAALSRLVRATRQRVGSLRANYDVSDAALFAVGVRRASKSRRRVKVLDEPPALRLEPMLNGRIRVSVHDPGRPRSMAMPRQAASVWLYQWMEGRTLGLFGPMGNQAQDGDGGLKFLGAWTRSQFEIAVPAAVEPGAELLYAARWVSRTCEPGPMSGVARVWPYVGPLRMAA